MWILQVAVSALVSLVMSWVWQRWWADPRAMRRQTAQRAYDAVVRLSEALGPLYANGSYVIPKREDNAAWVAVRTISDESLRGLSLRGLALVDGIGTTAMQWCEGTPADEQRSVLAATTRVLDAAARDKRVPREDRELIEQVEKEHHADIGGDG